MVAYQQLGNFRNDSKFSTWLLGVARHKVLEFLRQDMRRRTKNDEFFQAEIARHKLIRLSDLEDPDLVRSQQEQSEALRLCLDRLPEKSRALIDQFYFDQQSSSKIAAKLNQKSNAIRMKLMRIRGVLLKCIQRNCSVSGHHFQIRQDKP